MTELDAHRWLAVSSYLSQALDLPAGERDDLVASLRAKDPALADDLLMLLADHAALTDQGFLERRPPMLLGRPVLAGQTIGAYTLISLLGQGGMGSVWLAERSDGRFERRVAVKFLSIALVGRGEERFKREGSILARLTHPHIANLVDGGVSATGQPYLILEHIDGEHIDRYCDRHTLPVPARIRLFLDVLAAVAHAHATLIVHRDIKPSNVLVADEGTVKLLDFGIAKLLEDEADPGAPTRLTRDGGGALTPLYAAPEQITGGSVSTATDVYTLGVLLYVLLTGRHPAGSHVSSPADLVKAIVDTEPPRPSDVVAQTTADAGVLAANAVGRATTPEKLRRVLRGDLDTIIGTALKKDPQKRYPSVMALADDLRRYLKQKPISARPDALAYRAAMFIRRNRPAVALATLALLASLAGVAGTVIQSRTARAQRDFALRQLSRAEAINELNNFVLSDAAPSGKLFTVNDLLARAEHIVERQQDKHDPARIEILISLGRQYLGQDEDAKSRPVLAEAYELSRTLPEPSIRARASCALASILARGAELPRAETLIQEGLSELPAEPQFELDRVFCLLRGSEVSRLGGDAQLGIARVRAGQRLLNESPLRTELADLRALMDLAESYRVAGQMRDSIAVFEQAAIHLASLGRDDTQTAGTLYNNWGMALWQLGRPLDAEKIFRRAIDITRAGETEDAVSPMLLVNYARPLRDLARLEQAADYAERGYEKARRADDQVVINTALLLRARIYRDQRDLGRAAAMLDEVEPGLRRNLPVNHYAFASLASERALIAAERGDLQAALTLSDQAVTIIEASVKAGQQGAEYLPIMVVRRSEVELHVHRVDAAVADATRGVSVLQEAAQPATSSLDLGRAHLALGRALHEQGKTDQARPALQAAVQHLQGALGANHPETVSARQLACRLSPAVCDLPK